MGKHEDADLILKLYELRRESVMREARNWFFTFNPTSIQDFMDVMFHDKHSAYYRMVVSYWEMAATLVNHGAIDEQLFNEANGEHLFVYSKIQPFIPILKEQFRIPEYLPNFEKLVSRMPNIEERLTQMRERMKELMALREQHKARAQAAAAD
jgi:hypothetical protein